MRKDKRILIPRDEFEEEAGEGLGRLSREEADADLHELKARMERRVARPRAIWLPAAAAVLILLVASGILVSMLRGRPVRDMQLAQKGSSPESKIIAETGYDAGAGEAITDTALIAMAEPLVRKDHSSGAPAITERIVPEEVADAVDEINAVVEEDAEARVVANKLVVANEVMVVDEPVVQIVSAWQAEEVVVEALPQVTVAGMRDRSKKADRDTAREASGIKDKAMAEAKEATEIKTAAAAAAVQGTVVPDSPASPASGWSEYREWVTENIRYPEGIIPEVRQEVLVSFTVLADSTISDLKTVSSPGLPFTREVFRLLQEGPQWVPARHGGEVMPEMVVLKYVFRHISTFVKF